VLKEIKVAVGIGPSSLEEMQLSSYLRRDGGDIGGHKKNKELLRVC